MKINLLKLFVKMGLNVRMRECEKALLHLLDEKGEDPNGFLLLGSANLAGKGNVFSTPYKAEYDRAIKAGGIPLNPEGKQFSRIAVIGTKQKEETAGLAATALKLAAPDALIILSLENDWGGKGLDKLLAEFGCPTDHFSKHKSRLVWTSLPQSADETAINRALGKASPHRRADGEWTEAGVFSFEKLDRGSALLIEILNKSGADLSTIIGRGADFGCGIGDLSKFILKNYSNISHLTAIDHDKRAVDCATGNLQEFGTRTQTLWADICHDPLPEKLDFIVMNPPFHQGKTETVDLGKSFVSRAASSLRAKGTLLMVANVHLPYEEVLKKEFINIENLLSKDGFKVIRAQKK